MSFGPHDYDHAAELMHRCRDLTRQRDALLEACNTALRTMRHMDPLVERRWESDYKQIKAAIALCEKGVGE